MTNEQHNSRDDAYMMSSDSLSDSSKRRRRMQVTFASPVVTRTHCIPRPEGYPHADELKVAAGYARSAALFATAEEPDDDDEYYENFAGEGILICPSSGGGGDDDDDVDTRRSVSFAFPAVTSVYEIPRYSNKQKEELFYNSMDIAAFSINEILAGRQLFGQRNECSRQIPFGSACDDNEILATNGFETSGIEHSRPPIMIL